MATDATGTPTSPDSIPTYNTSADSPSGNGFNAAMAAIQTALSGRWLKSLFTTTGDIAYASGVSTPARLAIGSTGNVLTVAGGLPSWAAPASTAAMTLIDDLTVTGSVLASYDTNTRLGGNIPSTYKHLRFVYSVRGDTAAQNVGALYRFNNDSGANYDYTYMSHTAAAAGNSSAGAAVTSGRTGEFTGATGTANRVGTAVVEIFDYNGTTFDKMSQGTWSFVYDTAGNQMIGYHMSHWRSTAAITRFALTPSAGNFAIGSRFSLYGIN